MRPSVYIETTIPSFYFEGCLEPEMVARREWTRDWWDNHHSSYDLAMSDAVREVRHRISEPVGHDPHRLVAYYRQRQECSHEWVEGCQWDLIVTMDDATSACPAKRPRSSRRDAELRCGKRQSLARAHRSKTGQLTYSKSGHFYLLLTDQGQMPCAAFSRSIHWQHGKDA